METVYFGHGHSNQWGFNTYPSNNSLSIRNRGNGEELYFFQPNGYLLGSGFVSISPKNKENIKPLDKIVDKLKPVSYYNPFSESNEYGFIPEELEKIIPEIVDGQALNLVGLIPILVKEIQELKKQMYLLTDSNLCNSPCSSVKSAELSYDKMYDSNDILLNGLTGTKILNRPDTFFIKPASFRGVTGPCGII